MANSMTAFARTEFEYDGGRGAWEIRSVNHRYAELSVRLPEEFRAAETAIRERIGKAVKRGKVDCTLRTEAGSSGFTEIQFNQAAAEAVIKAAERIAELGSTQANINPLEILRWPGVTEALEFDRDNATRQALSALDTALEALIKARQREGSKLADMIEQRLDAVTEQVVLMRSRVPEIIRGVQERHQQKIRDLAEDLDAARIEQEMALLVQRLDVAEEIDRLEAHVDEVGRVLKKSEPIGRRLDFLMQELNREANTLGSKSAHVDTTGASVELKVLIEQMREQVQNIE